MGAEFIDSTVRAAWRAATSQRGQLEVVAAELVEPTLRYYSAADEHLRTVTHDEGTIDVNVDPMEWSPGGILADTAIAVGDATYVIASTAPSGGTDILRAALAAPMTIVAGSRPSLVPQAGSLGLRVLADEFLPGMPAWYIAAAPAINQWVALSGTSSLPGGSEPDAFCGWGYKSDTKDVYVIAAGGHTNSGSNCVVRLRLTDDAPEWELRRASTWNGVEVNVAHYESGDPAARHTYHTIHWVQSLLRFLLVGAPYIKGDGNNDTAVDGYDPATESYDDAGTYEDVLRIGGPGTNFGFGVVQDSDGYIWADHDRRYYPPTNAWDFPTVTGRIGGAFPQEHCPTLNINFSLQWGNGQAAGSGINAFKRDLTTLTDTAINWSTESAAAVAQFEADAPAYAGMGWDDPHGRYLFYAGGPRVYAITPNSGSEWDMEILPTTGTPPGSAGSGGVNSKFTFADLNGAAGFVTMTASSGGVHFLRTS